MCWTRVLCRYTRDVLDVQSTTEEIEPNEHSNTQHALNTLTRFTHSLNRSLTHTHTHTDIQTLQRIDHSCFWSCWESHGHSLAYWQHIGIGAHSFSHAIHFALCVCIILNVCNRNGEKNIWYWVQCAKFIKPICMQPLMFFFIVVVWIK